MTRERPILFSGEMVRAILDGRKTQTRRVASKLNPVYLDQHCDRARTNEWRTNREAAAKLWSPYGQPGDRLWVRETWGDTDADFPGVVDGRKPQSGDRIRYRADPADAYQWDHPNYRDRSIWRSSRFMPRWASRLTLELTGVRVERVQDISEGDCWAEGIERSTESPSQASTIYSDYAHPRRAYCLLWDSLNAKRGYGWDVNPWAWVLDFRVAPKSAHD